MCNQKLILHNWIEKYFWQWLALISFFLQIVGKKMIFLLEIFSTISTEVKAMRDKEKDTDKGNP